MFSKLIRKTARILAVSLAASLAVATLASGVSHAGWEGGHDVVGRANTSKTWFFAEGTTRSGFNEWVCLLNPNPGSTTAYVTYMLEGAEKIEKSYFLPGRSRTTVDVRAEVEAGNDVSVAVMAEDNIVVERPIYFRYKGSWTGGHDIIGANAPQLEWYFAEGSCRPDFETYICVQNPGKKQALVTIDYMLGDGSQESQEIKVPAESRKTVVVKQLLGEGDDDSHDFSARVASSNGSPIVAERPMYFNYRGSWSGGHDVMGALAPATSWYFAEGSCRPDFEPYICIQNPGARRANVTIEYMLGDGSVEEQRLRIPATSRKTVVVKDFLGEGDDPAHDFSAKVYTTNNTTVIAERPMYFNYTGLWEGGHDVVGALAPGNECYFAEGTCRPGFDPYLCIQNPNEEPANVQVTLMLGDGDTESVTVTVAAESRETLPIKHVLGEANDSHHDFSTVIESLNGVSFVAERPMYFDYLSTAVWTLSALGDVNLGGDMSPKLSQYGFDYPWTVVGDLTRATDVTFCNLECTMSHSGEPVAGKTFTFRGDPLALPYMADAGVDVVSQANNHARDYGGQSLVDCLGYLDEYGIAHCGAGADYESAHDPAFVDAQGLRVAFLAYDEIGYIGWYADPGYPGVADATDSGKLVADIRAASEEADIVVVSFHWGIEKQTTPEPMQTSLARLAVENGADLVLGHHPHVVQGFQFVDGKLVANSLGNFVFNPGSEEGRYTVFTHLTLDSEGFVEARIYPVYIENGRPILMTGDAGNAWINQVAARSQALGTPFRVVDGVGHIP